MFVDLAEAEREMGIATGDTKEVTSDDLAVDYTTKMPLFAIRPHQTLVIKAVGGKLSGPGSVGGGRLLSGSVVNDGAEVHFTADKLFHNHQGTGNSWIHKTDADGQSLTLRFGYLITKG
jgi:hypothetical protein